VFILALIPAALVVINLRLVRPLPPASHGLSAPVSLLIPARNEAARIGETLQAALASRNVEFEVVVLDDHSIDDTAHVVQGIAQCDSRLRLETAPKLPKGWCGKQHACAVLAERARHDFLVFVDADVQLAPDAMARVVQALSNEESALISGFPRQRTGTWSEKLLIPLIHFVLLGYLPIWQMRRSLAPSLGTGCGQLIAVKRHAYQGAGGHTAIAASLHDGVMLPRAFRRAGFMTDLFDATDLANCRMYRNAREVWQGLSKNATEGMATPVALTIWTILLGGGQVLPFIALALTIAFSSTAWPFAVAAVLVVYGTRLLLTARFRQSWPSALAHPVGILAILVIQWSALIRAGRGKSSVWRGRSYGRETSP
jgi:hypothetical protein